MTDLGWMFDTIKVLLGVGAGIGGKMRADRGKRRRIRRRLYKELDYDLSLLSERFPLFATSDTFTERDTQEWLAEQLRFEYFEKVKWTSAFDDLPEAYDIVAVSRDLQGLSSIDLQAFRDGELARRVSASFPDPTLGARRIVKRRNRMRRHRDRWRYHKTHFEKTRKAQAESTRSSSHKSSL